MVHDEAEEHFSRQATKLLCKHRQAAPERLNLTGALEIATDSRRHRRQRRRQRQRCSLTRRLDFYPSCEAQA